MLQHVAACCDVLQQVEETINENNRAEDGGLPGTSSLQANAPLRAAPLAVRLRVCSCVFVCPVVCLFVRLFPPPLL